MTESCQVMPSGYMASTVTFSGSTFLMSTVAQRDSFQAHQTHYCEKNNQEQLDINIIFCNTAPLPSRAEDVVRFWNIWLNKCAYLRKSNHNFPLTHGFILPWRQADKFKQMLSWHYCGHVLNAIVTSRRKCYFSFHNHYNHSLKNCTSGSGFLNLGISRQFAEWIISNTCRDILMWENNYWGRVEGFYNATTLG